MPRLQYPESVDDHVGLLNYRDDVEDACASYRQEIERSGVGNILYYLGKHWQTYDSQLGLWTPQFLPKGTPRPVVNQVAPLVNSVRSKPRSKRLSTASFEKDSPTNRCEMT